MSQDCSFPEHLVPFLGDEDTAPDLHSRRGSITSEHMHL